MALTKISTDGVKDDAITSGKIPANAVGSSELADNAVDSAAIAANAVTDGKIQNNAVTSSAIAVNAIVADKIAEGSVVTAKIANTAVTLAKLEHGTSSNDGKFLRANNGADPSYETLPASGKATNLVINGGMTIAQRGTSSTTSGYGSVDRFKILFDNTDESPTHAQVDLTSSDTGPYEEGFRKALKITNGNQTSGAGANDFIKAQQDIEGQNIVNSGWNATDPNSKLTISYWVKSSVAQTFYGRFRAFASTQYEYTYSFALSANTWTKVTETVPGNSNFSSIPNTNAQGFFHIWQCFFGTDFTNNKTLDTWAVKDNANKSPDMTPTWYTTNNSTFEITGVQLEVGDSASNFAFESYAETLRKCQRYYWKISQNNYRRISGYKRGDSNCHWELQCPVPMRTAPSPTLLASGIFTDFQSNFNTTQSAPSINEWNTDTGQGLLVLSSNWSDTHKFIPSWEGYSIEFSAEL